MNPPTDDRSTRRRLLQAGGALAASFGLSGCVISLGRAVESSERTFQVEGADAFALENNNGDVELTGGDTDAVTGTVRKESRAGERPLEKVSIESALREGTREVWVDTSNLGMNVSVTVDFDLTVPRSLPVPRATSSNGDVTATDLAGDGVYRSSNGEVDLESIDGFVTLESSNGDLTARDLGGLDGARTSNGEVDVDAPAIRQDVTCRSTNGDVSVAVGDDVNASVVLGTSNGDAEVQGVEMNVENTDDNHIEGELGDGGEYTLELRSSNGDVTLSGL
jgi:DUF4097 and DUF4098 domain-containing protein YvlB